MSDACVEGSQGRSRPSNNLLASIWIVHWVYLQRILFSARQTCAGVKGQAGLQESGLASADQAAAESEAVSQAISELTEQLVPGEL